MVYKSFHRFFSFLRALLKISQGFQWASPKKRQVLHSTLCQWTHVFYLAMITVLINGLLISKCDIHAPFWTISNTKDTLNRAPFVNTFIQHVVRVSSVTSWTIVSLLLFHCGFVVACSFLLLCQYPRLDHRSYPDPLTDNYRLMCHAPEHLKKLHLELRRSRQTSFLMERIRPPPLALLHVLNLLQCCKMFAYNFVIT